VKADIESTAKPSRMRRFADVWQASQPEFYGDC